MLHITTPGALRELATGITAESISASVVLFHEQYGDVAVIVTNEDTVDTPRVVIESGGSDLLSFVPRHLWDRRGEMLSRMASAADRARTFPVTFPRGWNLFKRDNLLSFFAVPRGDDNATRWIAEIGAPKTSDLVFRKLTSASSETDLANFADSERLPLPGIEGHWRRAMDAAEAHFALAKRPLLADIEIDLPPLVPLPDRARSYEEWLEVVSPDQSTFIQAETNQAIRLRGPAGSGKTLAITLKAIKEATEAKESGSDEKILVVTHSWALAAQISDAIDLLSAGRNLSIEILPLLEVAESILPTERRDSSGLALIGDDSFSGKLAQLRQILEVLDDFRNSEWITYRGQASDDLRTRLDSDDDDARFALAWDLLIEFGSVIGASGIFPGAGAELRYLHHSRAQWMLPLESHHDLRIVYRIYTRYMSWLEDQSLMTSDQLLADFLNYLETHAWNRQRRLSGWDLVFVDEFHLFSPLEREVLHYLNRDVSTFPRVFMAFDPRQSPSQAYIGAAADDTRSALPQLHEGEASGDVRNLELTTVHRFTPQILELIKHVHLAFPTLDLGHDWDIDFSAVESASEDGPKPVSVMASTHEGEEIDIFNAMQEAYAKGRVALAVVDVRQWRRYDDLATRIASSGKYHVTRITGRTDVEGLGYRNKGLVVGQAEYLAGLQFETVLVAGMPALSPGSAGTNDKTRILSALYLAISRAEKQVRLFSNEEDGGTAEVIDAAVARGIVLRRKGTSV
ncbi:UvrD-helicase domain-containing protein [Microbacteriaceae bacterium 4G12]